jgi:hypothetical protein
MCIRGCIEAWVCVSLKRPRSTFHLKPSTRGARRSRIHSVVVSTAAADSAPRVAAGAATEGLVGPPRSAGGTRAASSVCPGEAGSVGSSAGTEDVNSIRQRVGTALVGPDRTALGGDLCLSWFVLVGLDSRAHASEACEVLVGLVDQGRHLWNNTDELVMFDLVQLEVGVRMGATEVEVHLYLVVPVATVVVAG